MSQTVEEQEQEKNMDKKETAEEEREKMLNAENTKHASKPVADLEIEENHQKRKIPIGGIKMPGFCRSKSKETNKDDNVKSTDKVNAEPGLAISKDKEQNPPSNEVSINVEKESKEKESSRGIFRAMKLPLASVFPRKKKETGEHDIVGLASVETLGDVAEKVPAADDAGMETVRLDGNAFNADDPPKPHSFVVCLSAARRNLFVTVSTLLILITVIVIICVACVGPRYVLLEPPLKDGKYILAPTSCGLVEGILEDGGYAFRGIPYAVPPISNRRWQPAEPLRRIENCWTGTYSAHNNSIHCWQFDSSGRISGTEDCLKLDVFTPKVDTRNPLPVVVMIGAETLNGGSPGVMQPSSKLARVREIVFVRPNFRMGVFGFLAAEPLSRTTHPPTSGNYGLSDIIVALKWIQNNIHHFGGCKNNVTIWGHRAGGTLVTTLIGARKANDLFARAWISSSSAIFPGEELSKSEKSNEVFLNATRCSDAACLRSKDPEELMNAVPSSWLIGNVELPEPKEAGITNAKHEWLVKDGSIIQEHVGEIWTKQDLKVKIVIGTTAQSGTPVKYLSSNSTLEADQVNKIVRESLLGTNGLADEALRRYNSTLKGLATMISDIRVVCPLLTIANMKTNIPFYVRTRPRGETLADPDSDAAAILGSYTPRTVEEKRHVDAMQKFFNRFVWFGEVTQADPRGAKRILIVDQDIHTENDYPNCDFWINKNIAPKYGRVD
ncbi:neurotactin isoform X2 [Leptopilina boulardi]|uniref:neurotactin isoform X2 n=1 Tax=Leptopilina boulardi TaxID=63433 RepID=UPI0021F5791F|nr:neurotactin isoform X2 [Leptopilina boulardi]